MNNDSILQFLSDFSSKHDLISRAKQSCSLSISTQLNAQSNPEESYHMLEDFKLEFDYQSLVFEHHFGIHPYIKTRIGVFVDDTEGIWNGNLKPVGYYELETDLEGNNFDDLFVCDFVKS